MALISLVSLNYHDFRQRRARPGRGQERRTLLAELKMEESIRDHLIIRGAASGNRADPETVKLKTENDAQLVSLVARLTEITRES